ncbi:MAG: hypothetical protein ACRDQX_04005 [Pseudonocardiaceae bacterium]
MTVQPDIPRRVNQMRHDLDDLYELMSQVNQSQTRTAGVLLRHNNRFEELQQTLDLHSGRLDRIEDGQRRQFERLDRIEDGQRGQFERLDRIEDGQRGQFERLDRIEDGQRSQFERLSAQMAEILTVLRGPTAADPAAESER